MSVKRGEIWLVNLDPVLGAEIRKTRPVVVVNSDAIGVLPIRLVAPITEWKDYFAGNVWHVKLEPNAKNGLTKPSVVDTLQLRGIDTLRFVRKNRPLGKDQTAKRDLKFSPKCSIMILSRWQTYEALPLGNVSASHFVGDKSVIREILCN